MLTAAIALVERGWVPDFLIRYGIRTLLRQRLRDQKVTDCQAVLSAKLKFIENEMTGDRPVAPLPEKANEQHYEVPPDFFSQVLGTHRKYSCCEWDSNTKTLEQAEAKALATTCERAEIRNGQRILELGCGWGSLTLWMAENYPAATITAVSNSAPQRHYIMAQASKRGLSNVTVLTADMNTFSPPAAPSSTGTEDHGFDRIVSLEMFEHMRNYELLFHRLQRWLRKDGKFFMHIFCHRDTMYPFIPESPSDWMSRYFFSGGIMPSDDLPLRFQTDLKLQKQWRWDGTHYEKTSNAWLAMMDSKPRAVRKIIGEAYGVENTELWWVRWRLFFMSCAELFGFNKGQEWWVSHYLFQKRS
jgi:cyclopropane-fatty-acyl-phospholipid synthase